LSNQQQRSDGPPCPKCGRKMIKGNNGLKSRWKCVKKEGGVQQICYQTTNPNAPVRGQNYLSSADQFPKFNISGRIAGAHTLIITTAQNATPVHRDGWLALKRYAKKVDAEIVVIPLRYSNPTSIWSKNARGNMWWAPEVVKHLHNERTQLNKNLMLLADINVIPTTQSPLTDKEGFTGHMSGILGHPRAQTKSIATPGHKMAKLMMTTGVITKSNYIPSNVGKAAEHHHIFGALIVELEGPFFWVRRLNMDSKGAFIDLDTYVHRKGVSKAPRPLGIELGDTHVRNTEPSVDAATFGPKGIVTELQPEKIMWNDVLDGQTVNPHEAHDPFIQQALVESKRDNVEDEVKETIDFVRERSPTWATSYIKISNHDDFLRRWVVKNTDWTKVPPNNRKFLVNMTKVMLDGAAINEKGFPVYPSPFPHCVEQADLKNVTCLKPGQSLVVGKYECQYHGHNGPNGAKGSLRNLSRIGAKVMTAHGHGPGEENGSMQVGHSSKEGQPFTALSPSSWLWAHGLINANGKAQLIIIVNGRYRR
jgi:hypothetical protein